MNTRITVLALLPVALAGHAASAQSAGLTAPETRAETAYGPRRMAADAPSPIVTPLLSAGSVEVRHTVGRASTGRQALHGALIGAAAGLVTGLLLDEGGYSAGGADDEEGGSTVWIMVPVGAAVGALLAVVL